MDGGTFRSAFDRFRALVETKSGHPFRGFDEGLAADWENYKPRLRDHALGLLRTEDWLEGEIGSGAILNRTVRSDRDPGQPPQTHQQPCLLAEPLRSR